MAYDKVIDSSVLDANLLSVADAIREKAGVEDNFAFPAGFVEAISNIEVGSGGDDSSFKDVIERTATNPTLPNDLTKIGAYTFYSYSNLALTELPAGVTKIVDNAFYNCSKLALTELPAGVIKIVGYAFYNCTGLTSLTFKGKPSSINSSAFNGCTNLTTINVPWAEGEVANAPWGATNATINYNYTGA